jgi:hypothetical protein
MPTSLFQRPNDATERPREYPGVASQSCRLAETKNGFPSAETEASLPDKVTYIA